MNNPLDELYGMHMSETKEQPCRRRRRGQKALLATMLRFRP